MRTAALQFLLYDFNSGYLSRLAPVCGYALFVYYGGKHVLQPENERFQLGDLVLLLSTVKSFGSSISCFSPVATSASSSSSRTHASAGGRGIPLRERQRKGAAARHDGLTV